MLSKTKKDKRIKELLTELKETQKEERSEMANSYASPYKVRVKSVYYHNKLAKITNEILDLRFH